MNFKIDFYVTDHSANLADTAKPHFLGELYQNILSDGITSVRYDWDWSHIEPTRGHYHTTCLERYVYAKRIMEKVGLKVPTIILSNPPDWAKKLYKEDKEEFFAAYKKYALQVRAFLEIAGGEKISVIQVFNELNVSFYTPVKVEDIPRACQITRDVFQRYNPEVRLMVSLLASNSARFVGTLIEKYLPELKKIKENFDIIAIDYYPGMWHIAPKNSVSFRPSDLYKAMVKNLDLLRATFYEIATWGKEYEIGEVGMRTNAAFGGSERAQRYFYDSFFRAFKHMLIEMRAKQLLLPTRVGLYEALDEPPKDWKGRLLRKLTPFPEHDLGLRRSDFSPKFILSGRVPRLQRIMNYVRA